LDIRYFEQAADALSRAIKATNLGEQALLLEEALRFNRLGLDEERRKLSLIAPDPPSVPQKDSP
jgi:hypothetical protein